MECPLCGRLIEAPEGTCTCRPRAYVLNAGPGRFTVTGQPVGFILEGPPESAAGRRVELAPASGGRSYSRTDRTGAFTVELSGPLNKGCANQQRVLGVLVQALRERGSVASLVDGSHDDRGEDGLLDLDGRRVPVQVVSMPADQSVWAELSARGVVYRSGPFDAAVKMVRQSLVHKKGKAIRTLLVLDACHFAAIIGPSLVRAYHEAYGDPEVEFSLIEAWLVGPTARSAFRLGLPK
jgi:hypothetical protein